VQLVEHDDPLPLPASAKGIWIVFVTRAQLASTWTIAKQRGVTAISFEDLARHHKGEFQSPMPWIKQLVDLK
jgi:hypothetical protein